MASEDPWAWAEGIETIYYDRNRIEHPLLVLHSDEGCPTGRSISPEDVIYRKRRDAVACDGAWSTVVSRRPWVF